jgi:hypothetical protein
LAKGSFEIYNINIFKTPLVYEKSTKEFIDILKYNLRQLQSLAVGDIIKMNGLKILNRFVLYHHHAIYTGKSILILVYSF